MNTETFTSAVALVLLALLIICYRRAKYWKNEAKENLKDACNARRDANESSMLAGSYLQELNKIKRRAK